MVEIMVTVGFLALTSLASLSVVVSTMTTDVEVTEHNLAMRAAMSRIEELQSFDFEQDVPAFIDHLQDSATNRFEVDGLRPVADLDAAITKEAASLTGYYEATVAADPVPLGDKPPSGAVIFDASDTKRISVVVIVAWVSAATGEERSVRLATVFSGMKS